jgi:hypothetical protein
LVFGKARLGKGYGKAHVGALDARPLPPAVFGPQASSFEIRRFRDCGHDATTNSAPVEVGLFNVKRDPSSASGTIAETAKAPPELPQAAGPPATSIPSFSVLDLPAPKPRVQKSTGFRAEHTSPLRTETAPSPLGRNRQPRVLPVKPVDRSRRVSPLGRNSASSDKAKRPNSHRRCPLSIKDADQRPAKYPRPYGSQPPGISIQNSEITELKVRSPHCWLPASETLRSVAEVLPEH